MGGLAFLAFLTENKYYNETQRNKLLLPLLFNFFEK